MCTLTSETIFGNWKPFESNGKCFLFHLKRYSQDIKFLSWLFCHVAKRFDKKDQVNFQFYDVSAWLTNNCNTHIAQYLEK